jgi:methylated-DNA-protein-cysteine methyltransferase-like protein
VKKSESSRFFQFFSSLQIHPVLTPSHNTTRIFREVRVEFEEKVKAAIKSIPRGRVATYTQVAALAGNHRAARQVVRVLHVSSAKDRLPWHRVINSRGGISLKRGRGFEEQMCLLIGEGVSIDSRGRVGLEEFQWEPESRRSKGAKKFLRELTRLK